MLTFGSVYILVIVTVFISIIIRFIRSIATLTHIRGLIIEPLSRTCDWEQYYIFSDYLILFIIMSS